MLSTELDNIRSRYSKRDAKIIHQSSINEDIYTNNLALERENIYYRKLLQHFGNKIKEARFLEIGAGFGYNLHFFSKSGIPWSNIYANELMENRLSSLKESFPKLNIIPGNALDINENQKFDIILISTVFSSIINYQFRKNLAQKALSLLSNEGLIILYDFIYDNPHNDDVKKISKKEVKVLFNGSSNIEFRSVTIAPPIGRKIGKLYNIISKCLPFFRSHIIAFINK